MDKGNLVEAIQWRTAKSTALLKTSLDFHSGVGLNQAQQKLPSMSTAGKLLED